MAKRKRPSKYQQELRNARRRIKRLQERGYILNESVPSGLSLQKLKKEYSLEALYERARYVTESGIVLTGTEARKALRSRSARRGWETRRGRAEQQPQVTEEYAGFETLVFESLDSLIATIESWSPEPLWTASVIAEKENQKDKLLDLLTNFNSEEERLRVAEAINDNAMEINEIAHRIMYETYRFDLVYYEPRGIYDFSADYARLAEIIGKSRIPSMEI